jgi:WXG100 family type VII secretion target
MSEFAVDLAELDGLVEDLAAFTDRLDDRLHELETVVAAVQADWQGVAAQAQREAHRRICRGARELHAGLAQLRAVARHAHRCYTAAVSANAHTWARLSR